MGTVHLGLFMMLCFVVNRSSSQILQRHKRNWIIESFSIYESYKGSFPYSLGTIQLDKSFSLYKIKGQGFDEEPRGILKIDENTGQLTVHGPVDYEKFKSLKPRFQAFNKVTGVIDTRLSIEIIIVDDNDNAPEFDRKTYSTTVNESTTQGTTVITIKATDVDSSERFQKFDLRIVSTTPEPQDLEFYLTQPANSQHGTISFKGCLDREKAEKYVIIAEARDRENKQLSSTCTVIINIEDGNNHLPVITQQTGPVTVKEGQEGVVVTRLQVTDQDAKGTEAWRARFIIHGDANNYFNVTTNPDTNEGLLYVQKPLDYEVDHQRNVTITVENEIPYYSCKVRSRSATGLWGVSVTSSAEVRPLTSTVVVNVEDVKEPPVFDEPNKIVYVKENDEPGQFLWSCTARDPDGTGGKTFKYRKVHDPARLLKVDPVTGNVTLTTSLDRESHFLKDNIYVASVCATDNADPPMTSTATLSIYVMDENDNNPSLKESSVDMCQADGPSRASITAVDLDEYPYAGPFSFKLLGDFKGKWRIDPEQGHTVDLVKESPVYAGRFDLLLEVSDLQGKTAVQRLTVWVRTCLAAARSDCRSCVATGSGVRLVAVGIILLSTLLFAEAELAFRQRERSRGITLRVYAEERDAETRSELDVITILNFNLDFNDNWMSSSTSWRHSAWPLKPQPHRHDPPSHS